MKLVKSETPLCGFAKVGVKGGENSSECRESWSARFRSETPSCIFTRGGLKGVQIARNIAKVGVHIFISNGHPNL